MVTAPRSRGITGWGKDYKHSPGWAFGCAFLYKENKENKYNKLI